MPLERIRKWLGLGTGFRVSNDGMITWDYGDTVPSDATAGYAEGCIFQHRDGSAGSHLFINEGTEASCDFNAISSGTFLAGIAWTDAGVQRAIDIQITPTVADRQLYMNINYAGSSKEAAYIIASGSKITGEVVAVRARAQSTAASGATGEVRGVYGQGIANAALFCGYATGVFGNAIAKTTSVSVGLRGGFFEAESEGTPTSIANIWGIHVRCKTSVAVTTDYIGVLIENEKIGTGVAYDSFLAFKTTTWAAGNSVSTYVVDMNALVGTVTSIFNLGAVTATNLFEVDATGDGAVTVAGGTYSTADGYFTILVGATPYRVAFYAAVD